MGFSMPLAVSNTTINTPTPIPVTPVPTPNPTNTTQPTTQPSIEPTKTISLALSGNISLSQISNITVTTNASKNQTTVSFALTGQNGTVGFCNMTLPKNAISNATNPLIYIDNEPAQNQGFTQDAYNYYVWFTTHFSTHQVSIEFSNEAYTGGVEGTIGAIQILYGVAIALVIVVAVLAVLKLALRNKNTKALSSN